MQSNNRRNVFAHDDIDYLLGSIIVTYPFSIIVLSKLFRRVFSKSTFEMSATESVGVCGLACHHLGFAMISGPWARV